MHVEGRMFITGRSVLFLLLAAAPVWSQQGNRKGHENMKSIVPADEVPAAPVLPVDQALKTFELAPGFIIEPVAAEPLVDRPVCIDFDPAGRMWVCEMNGYMPDIDGKGEDIPQGRIVVLEDTDHDGSVDKRTVFLDKILLPRALAVFPDGVLFIDQNQLCWIKRDGLQASGDPVVLDPKFAAGGNAEHKPNGLLPNLDNWLYLAKSDKRIRRVAGEWLIEKTSFRGQWGIARDDHGRLYHNSNSTLLNADRTAPDLLDGNPAAKMRVRSTTQLGNNRVWPIRVTPGVNRGYIAKSNGYDSQTLDPETYKLINATAAAGMAIYRGTNFPKTWLGRGIVTESTVQLVKAIAIDESNGKMTGSHPLGEKEFIASTDERFRPVNAYNAPDGSLYVIDFYHGIIQHKTYMTSYLREQTLSRGLDKPGHGLGRIYRIRHSAGQLEQPIDMASLQGRQLVAMLAHANAWHRETAQRVMTARKDPSWVPDLALLTKNQDARTAMHAIWTLEGMGMLTSDHLKSALVSKDPNLRNSALWAVTRLSSPQRQLLAPGLSKLEVSTESIPYLAKALATCNHETSDKALATIMEKHQKIPFVREAAVAGLRGREQEFLASHLEDSKDKTLIAWLENASKAPAKAKINGGLTGADAIAFKRGKALYHGEAACVACHGADGGGLPDLGPPLDGSEWVTGKVEVLAKILLHGMTGPVEVAGETYAPPAAMPGMSFNPAMTDQRLADLASYIRHEWSNTAGMVAPEAITRWRAATTDRSGRPYVAAELKQ
ncbi:DUF7133 domain-containing protein [Haloferula rosea]|uniref:C-type cytochrome n=1 Tax=Haloferula rosea TaxID=490093 RepID=A0A934R8B5_9BACT|nr:c-type cytochrome [Haloferula rosea]MBK1826147.1 c-type cytochrome [Haloferula rosea]